MPLDTLRHISTLAALDEAAGWLRAELTPFGRGVSSWLPRHFDAYARLYHPFAESGLDTLEERNGWIRWLDLARSRGVSVDGLEAAEAFALGADGGPQARVGALAPALIDVLVEHLGPATATPDSCYFALWSGFAGSAVPADRTPQLLFPAHRPVREYHVFAGPLSGARTNFAAGDWRHQSANLWWPADRAWCVASEIDFAWTYVGGARGLIEALLAEARLESAATEATAAW
jgi:hypothetical protein